LVYTDTVDFGFRFHALFPNVLDFSLDTLITVVFIPRSSRISSLSLRSAILYLVIILKERISAFYILLICPFFNVQHSHLYRSNTLYNKEYSPRSDILILFRNYLAEPGSRNVQPLGILHDFL
jgi:hypothetical protein